MASKTHATNERAVPASNVPSVESFAGNAAGNGDLSINLNRSQWQTILGSLAIASGQVAIERDYEQVMNYAGLCNSIGTRLGFGQQTAAGGDLPPPVARAAAAS